MKNILIAGCSFSFSQKNQKNRKWKPYSDMIEDNFDVTIRNEAKSSFGQSRIVDSVISSIELEEFLPDFVIIQLSAFSRGYSINQEEFIKRIIHDKSFDLSTSDEDLINQEIKDRVSYSFDIIEKSYYINSFSRTLLLKNYLQNKKIPYMMFHGWQQIDEKSEWASVWENKIYDTNFWRHNNFGGLSEFVVDNIGELNAIVPNDFHPSTKGHRFFYEKIIYPLLKENGFEIKKELKTIDKKQIF